MTDPAVITTDRVAKRFGSFDAVEDLTVYPVLLGTGKLFFAEGTPARSFELVSTQSFPSGTLFSTYKVAGPLKIG